MFKAQGDIEVALDNETGTLRLEDWGDMTVAFNRFSPGADLTPVLGALADKCCPVPHWGYLLEGTMTVGYTDGTSETIEAGHAFHLPAGHDRVHSDTGCTFVEFSPADQMAALLPEIGPLLEA